MIGPSIVQGLEEEFPGFSHFQLSSTLLVHYFSEGFKARLESFGAELISARTTLHLGSSEAADEFLLIISFGLGVGFWSAILKGRYQI